MIWYAGAHLQESVLDRSPWKTGACIRYYHLRPRRAPVTARMVNTGDHFTSQILDSVPERAFAYFSEPGYGVGGVNGAYARLGLVEPWICANEPGPKTRLPKTSPAGSPSLTKPGCLRSRNRPLPWVPVPGRACPSNSYCKALTWKSSARRSPNSSQKPVKTRLFPTWTST